MSVTDTFATTAKTVQDWSLSALKNYEGAITEASKTVAGAFEPVARRIRTAPLASRLPDPADVAGRWFEFVENVVATQKRLSLEWADALVPSKPVAPSAKASAHKPGGAQKA